MDRQTMEGHKDDQNESIKSTLTYLPCVESMRQTVPSLFGGCKKLAAILGFPSE